MPKKYISSQALLRELLSPAEGQLLYWMFTLWNYLRFSRLVILATARSQGVTTKGMVKGSYSPKNAYFTLFTSRI